MNNNECAATTWLWLSSTRACVPTPNVQAAVGIWGRRSARGFDPPVVLSGSACDRPGQDDSRPGPPDHRVR
jgi:hypothetical protein